MSRTRRTAALAASLTLALPAGALAQGAGDNQYTDPFAGENQGSNSGSGSGSGTQGGAEGSNGSDSQLSNNPPGQNASQQSSGQLPRTGADPALMVLLGAGFVLAGAGLRVRVRRPLA